MARRTTRLRNGVNEGMGVDASSVYKLRLYLGFKQQPSPPQVAGKRMCGPLGLGQFRVNLARCHTKSGCEPVQVRCC
jgi:hypothetical protein